MSLNALTSALLTFLAWFATAQLSRGLADVSTQTTVAWLASGVTFGVLVVASPGKRWPVLIGAAAAAALWSWLNGLMLLPALGFGLSEILAASVGAWVVRSLALPRQPNPLLAYAGLLLGLLVSAALGATGVMAVLGLIEPHAPLARPWLMWACSAFVGMLLVAPLIQAFAHFRAKRSGGMPMAQFLAGAVTLVLFFIVAALIFSSDVSTRFGASLGPTLTYLPLPLIVITAVLWGERGAALATLAAALALICWTNAGSGPFAQLEGFRGEAALEVQGYVVVMAVLVGLVVALGALHTRALSKMRAWRLRYQQVLACNQLVVLTLDARDGYAHWSEGASQLLHTDVTAVNNVQAWINLADAAEQPLMQRDWTALTQGSCERVRWQHELRRSDGSTGKVHVRLCAVRGGDSKVEHVVALIEVQDEVQNEMAGAANAA